MWVMWSISSWNGGPCCYSNGLVSQYTCWLYSLWFMWLIPYLLLFMGLLKCHFFTVSLTLSWRSDSAQAPNWAWVWCRCLLVAEVWLAGVQLSVGGMCLGYVARVSGECWCDVGWGRIRCCSESGPYMGALWSGLGPLLCEDGPDPAASQWVWRQKLTASFKKQWDGRAPPVVSQSGGKLKYLQSWIIGGKVLVTLLWEGIHRRDLITVFFLLFVFYKDSSSTWEDE